MLLPCRLVRRQMPASGFICSGRRPLAQCQRGQPQHRRRLPRCHLLRPSPSPCRPRPHRVQVEAAAKDCPEKVSCCSIKIIFAHIAQRFISTTPPSVPSENSCGGGNAEVSWVRNQKDLSCFKRSHLGFDRQDGVRLDIEDCCNMTLCDTVRIEIRMKIVLRSE